MRGGFFRINHSTDFNVNSGCPARVLRGDIRGTTFDRFNTHATCLPAPSCRLIKLSESFFISGFVSAFDICLTCANEHPLLCFWQFKRPMIDDGFKPSDDSCLEKIKILANSVPHFSKPFRLFKKKSVFAMVSEILK